MYTIEIEKECGCFKKSDFQKVTTYESREDMINRARVMECLMNQQFCMTHFFEAVDYGEKIIIHSTVRPVDEEDEDVEDARDLIRKTNTIIGFNPAEEPPKNSNSN